ncbi:DUF2513 domain-containing protein [Pseudomonas sp. MAFF 730085]|uniref:DUF2513 domain-containing protein n=1 Tax=Pseudomonas kitaguniensis TaxID=2607908 RepID=A0A5N7JT57_9PSED|nr:DUF2513 domain-containing protein [Pseudomonas kitaguniensis]MPQ84505.1 DUF2513 domain-containing protein [Pseudomonas kitaguniensis]
MKRDKELALRMLQVVQENADTDGMDLTHLRAALPGRHEAWTIEMVYHLGLLVDAGYLSKKAKTGIDPASVQLTWAGHDLIEQLMK